ncbi:UNVERIFIED_CONTAM: hypothetical protein NCL1_15649 [Trichonephila clavipes]
MLKRKRVNYTANFKLKAIEKATEVRNQEAARDARHGKPHWPELEEEINQRILKERDNGKFALYEQFQKLLANLY